MATFSYSNQPAASAETDVLVLPMFQGDDGPEAGPGVKDVKGIDLLGLYAETALRGKKGDDLLVPNTGIDGLAARSVLLVGVGKRGKVTPDVVRRVLGKVAPQLARRGSVVTTVPQIARSAEDGVQAAVEGYLLGSYRFDEYRSGKTEGAEKLTPKLESFTVAGALRWDPKVMRAAVRRGEIVASAANWARDLVNTPAKECTPDYLARQAERMAADSGLEVRVWNEEELAEGGFGGIIGVGQGSVNPPRLIELRYKGAAASQAPIALTGKGVSFDSGGLSIKPSEGMEWMKADMAGAASILATMKAVAQLKPRINVIAAVPSSENLPSGSAIRPGDVLVHRGGKTSEVLNTDAEGRLILADALAYLSEQDPRVIIDTATLTGACMVALGEELWGAMGNDRGLIRDVIAAGEAAGEPGWELPLWEPYRRMIDSDVADVKNIGKRWGGAITAALFLAEFVDGAPWVHIDIAGPGFAEKAGDYQPKGGTGAPVRTLVRYVLSQAKQPARPARR